MSQASAIVVSNNELLLYPCSGVTICSQPDLDSIMQSGRCLIHKYVASQIGSLSHAHLPWRHIKSSCGCFPSFHRYRKDISFMGGINSAVTYAVSHAVQPATSFATALSTCSSTPIAAQVPNPATSHPAYHSTHFYQIFAVPLEKCAPLAAIPQVGSSHCSKVTMDLLPNPVAAYLTSRSRDTCRADSM